MRLIYADKLRKDVLDLPNCYNGFSDTYDKAMILDLVDEQPTVDAEPIRHGHWVHEFPNVGHLTHFYLCSVCRAEWNAIDNDMERFDFCPSCGAKMDGATYETD